MAPWLALVWGWGRWATREAWRAAPSLAQLPPTCREAMAHAALVCAGASPSYYPPGWGPWCLSWGWFCLGALAGGLVVAVSLCLQSTRSRSSLSLTSAQQMWHTAAMHVLACAAGEPGELQDLATQAGTSPEDLLCRLLREATAVLNGQPGGSPSQSRAPPPTLQAPPGLPQADLQPRRRPRALPGRTAGGGRGGA